VRADDRASSGLTPPPPGRLAPFEPRTQPSNSPQAPPEQPGPDIETWVQPTKLGKRQSWRGVAVPQATPQARRAQNGMPVELFANNSSRGPTGRSRTLCRLPSSARLYDWSATKPQPLLRGSISPIRTLVLPQRVQVPHCLLLVAVPAAVPLVPANKANKSRLHGVRPFLTTRRYWGGSGTSNAIEKLTRDLRGCRDTLRRSGSRDVPAITGQ
jgi:hypothetical protein